MSTARRLLAALGVAALLPVAAAVPAHAANYRFWGFFQQTDGQWAAATTGAAQAVPEHGTVDGWRYAVVGDDPNRFPRTDLTFEDICPDAASPAAGSKVVAVVVDSGTAEDSPDDSPDEVPGAFAGCAEVPADATSMEVLTAVADEAAATTGSGDGVVEEGGFVCSIAGYPAAGCDPNEVPGAAPTDDGAMVDVTVLGAEATEDPAADETPAGPGNAADDEASNDTSDEDSGSGSTTAVIVGVVVVLVLAIAAGIRARRGSGQRRDSDVD